jgi:hypothetical protein
MSAKTKTINSLRDLTPDARNANCHTERGMALLERSLRDYGAGRSILLDRDGNIIAGNATVETAASIGLEDVVIVPSDGKKLVAVQRTDLSIDDKEARELALADNAVAAHNLAWDADVLMQLDAEGIGVRKFFSDEELTAACDALREQELKVSEESAIKTLAERFGVPPFSVLDARQGYWQERKNAWLALGIKSEMGRDEKLTFAASAQNPAIYALRNEMRATADGVDPSWPEILKEAQKRGLFIASGTSGFDPVLCELAYRWFCPEGGRVLDPFSGGVTRGAMAALLGREYCGLDLNPKQIAANLQTWPQVRAAWGERGIAHEPTWINGDSTQLEELLTQHESFGADWQADTIFSCPPYAGLEIYSDDPRDLSRMDYAGFRAGYQTIIKAAVARLKPDRFACFVVGSCRDSKEGEGKGCLLPFIEDTIQAFVDAGCGYYNDAILLTPFGSLPIRVNAQFGKYRKLGRTHQYVLVFFKGDTKKIPELLGETEFGDLGVGEEEVEG